MRAAVLIPFLALFVIACTESDHRLTAPEVAELSSIGYGGTTDGVPTSETNVAHSEAFPSTNVYNIEVGWGNVTWNADDAGVGEAPLKFTSNRTFWSCFEYRIDDEDVFYPDADNPNAHITDGRWQYTCVNNDIDEPTIIANSHVDIRLSFGAERDERFDWTRFYVMTEMTKDDCKKGQWEALGFENQGQCIRYVETGNDSRVGAPTPDAFGDVVWTSGGSSPAEYRTQFTIFAEAPGSGTVYTARTDNPDANWTYTVTCVKIDGNEAWFGGERDGDNAFVIFYAKDDAPDYYFNQWTNNTSGHSCDNLGSWTSPRDVTEGSLTIN
jgi:hypothetical protein